VGSEASLKFEPQTSPYKVDSDRWKQLKTCGRQSFERHRHISPAHPVVAELFTG